MEILGSYDPHKKTTILKKERILHWIGNGAQPSDTVHNLLVREGIIEGKKVAHKMPRPEVKPEEVPEAKIEETVAETPAEEAKAEEVAEAEEVVVEAPVSEQAPVPAEEVKA